MDLDYDLASIPELNARNAFNTITNREKRVSYHKLEMDVELTVNQLGVNARVMYGKVENASGEVTTQGHRLAYYNHIFQDAGW